MVRCYHGRITYRACEYRGLARNGRYTNFSVRLTCLISLTLFGKLTRHLVYVNTNGSIVFSCL